MVDGISLVYVTNREDHAFEWFADSLARQLGDDDLEVVVVDGLASEDRSQKCIDDVGGRFSLRYVSAKPTVWNGRHRRTNRDLYAAASARNTGLVWTTQPYVVFVDDCGVLMPLWWNDVRQAARLGYVVSGARHKHSKMRVEDGLLVESRCEPDGIDHRWELGDDRRLAEVHGGLLYSSSVGFPRDLLLSVEGFDEICDGIGGEDYQLGLRLAYAGVKSYFSRSMLTVESAELHDGQQAKRQLRPELPPDRYMARLAELGVANRCMDGPFDAVRMIVDLVHGTRDPVSLGNHFDIAATRPADLESTAATLPERYWFDGRPWSELG